MFGFDTKSILLGLGIGIIFSTFAFISFNTFNNTEKNITKQEINSTKVIEDIKDEGNSVFKLNN